MDELTDDTGARMRDSFARQGMMTTLGAEMIEVGAGRCLIAAPLTPAVSQQQGAGHAALAFAIGDSAAGYAALSMMPANSEVMTVEMKINLMSPAIGERLLAEGRVIRAGRRITVVTAEVWAENAGTRKAVALLQGTMIPVTP